MKSKQSTAKQSKPKAFSQVFTQNNWTIFLGKLKLNFWSEKKISSSVKLEVFSSDGTYVKKMTELGRYVEAQCDAGD